ncbi:hypothetical protein AB0F15_20380 [Amycolatopsis sp. NPDC026612]|uniref:hypothetical protein n=1 Tax=Amycolatopsis sp. NPDC026612 TaxID=3155466 RepID=UPI0033F6C5C0
MVGYRASVYKHLIPSMGAHRLDKLQPEHLEVAYRKNSPKRTQAVDRAPRTPDRPSCAQRSGTATAHRRESRTHRESAACRRGRDRAVLARRSATPDHGRRGDPERRSVHRGAVARTPPR